MLFWMILGVFGFSIALIWNNYSKMEDARNLKLKEIRSKIEANDKAKKLRKAKKSDSEVDQDFENKMEE